MSDVIADLEKQLKERIEALDKQRKEEADNYAMEVAQRNAIAEAERLERIEQAKNAAERRKERERKREEEENKRRAESDKIRLEAERALNLAEEARRKQEEKLEWLQNKLAEVEFLEEQHSKTVQSPIVTPSYGLEENINIEHPEAPVNIEAPGDAVKGTDGNTPNTPLMSVHLKHILRQATRGEI